MRKTNSIILLLLIGAMTSAQIRFDNCKKVTMDDGLPSNIISDIIEDEEGFIWFATAKGLVRYDGHEASSLLMGKIDSINQEQPWVLSLMSSGDSLWIGTNLGISVYNKRENTLSRVRLDSFRPLNTPVDDIYLTSDIYEDRQGNVWMAPEGCGFVKWNRLKNTFDQFTLSSHIDLPAIFSTSDRTSLVEIIQDVRYDSIIWGFGMSGIYRLDQNSGDVKHYFIGGEHDEDQLLLNMKACGYQAEDGLIYSGSWHSGLSILNPFDGTYSAPWSADDMPETLQRNHVYCIVPQDSNNLYLTYSHGLFLFNTSTHNIQPIKFNVQKGEKVRYGVKLIDRQGRCYFGNDCGVAIADPITEQFKHYSLAHVNETDVEVLPRDVHTGIVPGYLTLCGQYTDGIYHIDLASKEVKETPFYGLSEDKRFFQAWDMEPMAGNNYLVAEFGGLYRYNVEEDTLIWFPLELDAEFKNYNSIIIDEDSIAWIGTHRNGLYTVDLVNKEVISHTQRLVTPYMRADLHDSNGNVWIITSEGHGVYDRKDKKLRLFDHHTDSSSTFRKTENFCECPNGEIWLLAGEEGIGLISDNLEKGVVERVIVRDSENNKVNIRRMICASDNTLWGISRSGLIEIRRSDWSARHYSYDYGAQFVNPLIKFIDEGLLLIASREGFYTIRPRKLQLNPNLPVPYLSRIRTRSGRTFMWKDIQSGDSIMLSPKENFLEIDFSSISHTLADKVTYEYMLQGLDDTWRSAGNQRSVTYAYLKGGEYTFRLRAANNEGIWNEDSYALGVMVGTPWYNSIPFYIGIVLLISSLVFLYNRQKISQVKKEEQMKAGFQKKMAEAEMSALRAQMNPHFIFNCLNSIESSIIRNDTRKASQYLNDFGRLIRLILQNSRSSYIDLGDEIESLQLYLGLEQMRLKHSFDFEIKIDDGLDPRDFEIPPMLIQPFVENSIWHGLSHLDQGGFVKVEISQEGSNLKCLIEDNGIGRRAAEKIKSSKRVKRVSMGMQITRERIEMLNQQFDTHNSIDIIDLYDEEGQAAGTRVILLIPI